MTSSVSTQYQSISQSLLNGKNNSDATAKSDPLLNATSTPTLAGVMAAEEQKGQDAFSVNLSADAQRYLSSQNKGVSALSSNSYTLNENQKQMLESVIARFADVEVNGDNYTQLYDELEKYGLSPEQLTLQEKVTSFNSTNAFMNALNGNNTDIAAFAASYSQVDDTKAENFMMDVVIRWQELHDAVKQENEG